MAKERLHFFDAINSNKRNSFLIMGGMFLFTLFFVWVIVSMFTDSFFGLIIAVPVSTVYLYISYHYGMSMVLRMSNAKPLKKNENIYLHHVVEGLAIAAGIPKPEIYFIEDPSPNAFATGKDPEHSAIAVTSGLLEKLNKRELTGVIAHEISHIANFDIRYMMIAVVVVGFIAILSQIVGRTFLYSRGNSRKGGEIFVIFAIVLMVLAPVFTELARLAISRQREYLADANGSRLTRDPKALADALKKISSYGGSVKNASGVTAPLYISNPLKGKFSGLFSTHPPAEERIKRLERM